MLIAGCDHDDVIGRIGAFHADHPEIAVVADIAHRGGLVDPGVPHHGGTAAAFTDTDAAIQDWVFDQAVGDRIEIDVIGFRADCHRTRLLLALTGTHLVKIRASVQAVDRHMTDIAHLEIAVQRAADGHRTLADVAGNQVDLQCYSHANIQLNRGRMRPLRQRVLTLDETKDNTSRAVRKPLGFDKLPRHDARETVPRKRGLSRMRAEPRPAYGHPAANQFAGRELGDRRQPDHR